MNQQGSRLGAWVLSGLEAAIAAQALMLACRLLLLTPAVADAMADLGLRLMPGAISGQIIDRFQFTAKPALLVGLIVAQLAAGAIAGLLVGLWSRAAGDSIRRAWTGSAAAAAILFALSAITLIGSGDLPSFAATARGGSAAVWLVMVASFGLFGAVLGSFGTSFAEAPSSSAVGRSPASGGSLRGRREVLGGAFTLATLLVAGNSLGQILQRMGERGTATNAAVAASKIPVQVPTPRPTSVPEAASAITPAATSTPPAPAGPGSTVVASPAAAGATPLAPSPGATGVAASEIAGTPSATTAIAFPPGTTDLLTPIDNFYVVSKNFVDPEPDVKAWKLEISGLVDHPTFMSFDELTKLPTVTRYQTMECISNDIGGDLISNGQWTGVLFTELFKNVGIKSGATAVNFTAIDGFTESLSLSEMMNGIAMLAHSLDGSYLTAKHGAPARLLTYNRYGMKQPKWIQKIELAASPIAGFWEQQGWDNEAIVKTNTRIDVPAGGKSIPVNQPIKVAGIAFAGSRGVSKVEVSVDAGKTWGAAEIEPALGPATWVRWLFVWTPKTTGNAVLMARATDGTGATQPATTTDSFPKGPDGYAQSSIQVV